MSITPTATPTPMPAFAPLDRPEDWSLWLGLEFVGAALVVVVVLVVALVGALVVVDGAPVNTVPTTLYTVAPLSHVAHFCGFFGKTLNRPAPELQQPFVWSQQYDVSVLVTLEQDIRSVPPVSALRQKLAHSGEFQFLSLQEPRIIFPSFDWHSLLERHAAPSPPPQHALCFALGSHGKSLDGLPLG